MTAVGDIVTVLQRKGFWVVMRQDSAPAIPDHRLWHLRQDRHHGASPLGYAAGEGDIVHVATPAFTPGDRLNVNGEQAEVIEDRGSVVAVFIERSRQIDGGKLNLDGITEVSRGDLVAENVNTLKGG